MGSSLLLLALAFGVSPQDIAIGFEDPLPVTLSADARSDPRGELRPVLTEKPSFIFFGKVEGSQQDLTILGASNNFGLTADQLKQGLRFRGSHFDAFLEGMFEFPFSNEVLFRLGAGVGVENIGTHVRAQPSNPVLGDPAGPTDTDVEYGSAPVGEVGAEFRYRPGGGPFDLSITVDFRGGGDSTRDALSDERYRYWRLRGGVFAGYAASDSIRPYVGFHATDYRADLRITDETTFNQFTLRFRYYNPVDVAFGVELASGSVYGKVEVDVWGSLSIMASAGIRF
jgi:hypothetical protein